MTETTVTYHTVTLSHPSIGPRDRSPVCNQTDLNDGGLALQGSPRKVRKWEITCLTVGETEMDALENLFGQRLTLTIDGVAFTGVMICPPWTEMPINSAEWIYTVNFVQETLAP